MGAFIIRYKGRGVAPAADVAAIHEQSDVTVLDTSDRMILVRSTDAAAGELARMLPDWMVAPERTIPLPDTRTKPRSEPSA